MLVLQVLVLPLILVIVILLVLAVLPVLTGEYFFILRGSKIYLLAIKSAEI